MKLSIAMIVKNEEKNLEKSLTALKSLDGKVDYEIIIVDTGSTDNTIEVAKKFTNKVYSHSWNNNFADMRNISIGYCTGEWVLVLDADEVLENPECLIEVLNSNKVDSYNSFKVGMKSFTGKNYVFGVLVRLFRNKKDIKYEGIVHEQLINHEPVGKSLVTFLHYGYSRDDYELMQYKYKRNKELLLKQLEGLKGKERIYPLFQLAKTYSMANKRREAFEVLKESYNLTKNRGDGLINTYVVHFYAQLLLEKRHYEEAIRVSKEGIIYSKNNIDYYYIIAVSYSELKKYAEAKEYINKYIDIRDKRDELQCDDSTLTESWYNRLDIILQYKAIGEYEEKNYSDLIKSFNAIEDEEAKKSLREAYLYCLIKVNLIDDVFKYFKEDKITDLDIEILINVIKRIEIDEDKKVLLEVVKKIMSLDKRLELYLKSVYLNEKIEMDSESIDFNKFVPWKGELFNALIDNDTLNVNFLRKINVEDIELYTDKIINNYDSLGKVYEFCKSRFLSSNVEELMMVSSMEKVLLNNNSIDKEKFDELAYRTFINRLNFIRLVYKEDVVNDDNILKFINEHDRVILKLKELIKMYSNDKLGYIKGLKKILNSSYNYEKIIKTFLDKANDNVISDEMNLEKENLYVVIENFLNESKVNEALEIIESLINIFVYDEKLLNYKGIALHLLGKNEEALINLAISKEVSDSEFDCLYNIACILEVINRKEDAKYYYLEALKKCEDDVMKSQLLDIINVL